MVDVLAERRRAGLTQTDLAALSGVSDATIRKVERGGRVSAVVLARLERTLTGVVSGRLPVGVVGRSDLEDRLLVAMAHCGVRSWSELSERTGVSSSTLLRARRTGRFGRVEVRERLEEALRLPAGALLESRAPAVAAAEAPGDGAGALGALVAGLSPADRQLVVMLVARLAS